jgi:hypothetical protein
LCGGTLHLIAVGTAARKGSMKSRGAASKIDLCVPVRGTVACGSEEVPAAGERWLTSTSYVRDIKNERTNFCLSAQSKQ